MDFKTLIQLLFEPHYWNENVFLNNIMMENVWLKKIMKCFEFAYNIILLKNMLLK